MCKTYIEKMYQLAGSKVSKIFLQFSRKESTLSYNSITSLYDFAIQYLFTVHIRNLPLFFSFLFCFSSFPPHPILLHSTHNSNSNSISISISTPLHSTPLQSTLHYTTLLYSTLLYSTLLYSTLLYSTLLYSTLLYSTLHYSTLLFSTLLYSTLLFSNLLYSTLLYSTNFNFILLSIILYTI